MRSSIGAALQEAALDPFLTGREHMRFQAALHSIPREERRQRGDQLLERVGLSDAADRKVGGYSGGMKRRLDLALALIHEPRILFLDEPTTGLDPQSRTALWEEVQRLVADRGVTVFLTTQYLEEADILARRIGIIDNGKIVAEGTPRDLITRYSTREVLELRLPAPEAVSALERLDGAAARVEVLPDRVLLYAHDGEAALSAVHDLGVQPESALVRRSTLEDVFLHLTGRTLVD